MLFLLDNEKSMKNIVLIIVGLTAIISCKKDEKPTYIAEETVATTAAQPASGSATVTPNTAVNTVPNAVQIDPNSPQVANFQVPNKANTNVKTAPGMNPPHGEPGHRCDIPVGQPLNSKPAAAATPAAAPQVINTTPAPQPVTNPVASGVKPKTNPPHGEPWHDCALKVGDPLP